jgi:hypothetical protein
MIRVDPDAGLAVGIVAYSDSPRLTADLTVLDIVLTVPAPRVESDDVVLATVGAHDGPDRVGGAITERKFLVEVIREIDHGNLEERGAALARDLTRHAVCHRSPLGASDQFAGLETLPRLSIISDVSSA